MRVHRPKTNNEILNERGPLKEMVCFIFKVTDTEKKWMERGQSKFGLGKWGEWPKFFKRIVKLPNAIY